MDKQTIEKIREILDKFFTDNLVVSGFNPNVDAVANLEKELEALCKEREKEAVREFMGWFNIRNNTNEEASFIDIEDVDEYLKQQEEEKL